MFHEPLKAALADRRARHLYRTRRIMEGPQRVEMQVGTRRLISFCSNDYLGLANHPELVAAMAEGARRYGVGAGASHLVTGHMRVHGELEDDLAAFVGRPRALLFSTGYMANLGLLQGLADRHSLIFEDRLNHASLIDAARLCGAHVRRIPHRDTDSLQRALDTTAASPDGRRFVVTDGVFSMDGDMANLTVLDPLCAARDALLVVDDAHGLGTMGPTGRGSFEQLGIPPAGHHLIMGTLGKAFGVFGAFVAGDEVLIDTLIQQARTYLYTTALPPALAYVLRCSLALVCQEPWRREALTARIDQFRRGAAALGLAVLPSSTPIQALIVGSEERALTISENLEKSGFLVPPIRPPTVPRGTSRLRITLSAAHTVEHVERLLEALAWWHGRQLPP